MAEPMRVTLRRTGPVAFQVEGGSGGRASIDGPAKLGGQGQGMRPMEMLLAALASCSAMDVVMILDKQRQDLEDLDIEISGTRAKTVPAVFTEITLHFRARGRVERNKLERAVRLSVDKYCSVSKMLREDVRISYTTSLDEPPT